MMLPEYLTLCPFHVKNKLNINKEVRGLMCSQVCSQVCTQRGHRNGAECLSSATPTTQNSPPCCCRVRKNPPTGAGPAAWSQSPEGLQGRLQPIYAEQPGEKTEMTPVRLIPAQLHVFPSTAWRDVFQEVAHLPGNLSCSSPWHLSDLVLLVTIANLILSHLVSFVPWSPWRMSSESLHDLNNCLAILVFPRKLVVFKICHFKNLVHLVTYLSSKFVYLRDWNCQKQ